MVTQEKIGVVIATYGRPESCCATMQSCAEAARVADLSCEMIVGINGSDPESQKILKECAKNIKGARVKLLSFEERETPAGFRNKLVEQCDASWLYFIDDDAFVDSDFFLKFTNARGAQPQADVIGGPNLTPPKSNLFQRATGIALASRFATYFSFPRYTARAPSKICGEESLILCNLFIRKSILGSNPFLSELLCCEESWLLQELEAKGIKLSYDNSLHVWHERRPNFFSLTRQVFKYGYGRGQILRKKPTRLRPAHLLPSFCVLYAVGFFLVKKFGPASGFFWDWPFILYPFFCAGAAATSARRMGYSSTDGATIVSAFLFPLIHVAYGCGLILGLARG